jgi:hypothetical protein
MINELKNSLFEFALGRFPEYRGAMSEKQEENYYKDIK